MFTAGVWGQHCSSHFMGEEVEAQRVKGLSTLTQLALRLQGAHSAALPLRIKGGDRACLTGVPQHCPASEPCGSRKRGVRR